MHTRTSDCGCAFLFAVSRAPQGFTFSNCSHQSSFICITRYLSHLDALVHSTRFIMLCRTAIGVGKCGNCQVVPKSHKNAALCCVAGSIRLAPALSTTRYARRERCSRARHCGRMHERRSQPFIINLTLEPLFARAEHDGLAIYSLYHLAGHADRNVLSTRKERHI